MRLFLYIAFFLLLGFLPANLACLKSDLEQDAGFTFPRNFTSNYYESWGYGIAMDKDDESIYTIGRTGTSDFMRFLLIKWDKEGNQLWSHIWESDISKSIGSGVTIDNNRSVYTVGNIYENTYDDSNELSVLTKWDLSGQEIFNRTWNGSTHKITADKNGSIYTMGRDDTNFLLIKWDSEGNQLWHRSSANGSGHGVTTDNDGKIYTLYNDIKFKIPYFHPTYPFNDSLLIVWDDSGNQLWNHTYSGFIGSVLVDVSGNIYLAGKSLMKLDSTGNLIWNQTLPREAFEYSFFDDLVLASDGNIYTVSDYNYYGYEKSTNTKKAPFSSIILAKWNIVGELIGIHSWHTREDYAEEIIMGKDGNIYCVGSYGESGPAHYLQVVIFSPTDFSSPPMPTSVTSTSVFGFEYFIVIPVMCLFIYFRKKKSLMERSCNH